MWQKERDGKSRHFYLQLWNLSVVCEDINEYLHFLTRSKQIELVMSWVRGRTEMQPGNPGLNQTSSAREVNRFPVGL